MDDTVSLKDYWLVIRKNIKFILIGTVVCVIAAGLITFILAGSPAIGPVNAFVAALLIRIVSFVSEILSAFVLYYCFRNRVEIDEISTKKYSDIQE